MLASRNCVDWQRSNSAGWCYLDLFAPRERNLKLLQEAPHSQLPACKGDMQHVIGIADSHDI